MTMGHRVAVLRDGLLQQCDTPYTLYHEPANLFVAGFIGSPAMNMFSCPFGQPLRVGGSAIDLDADMTSRLAAFGGDRVVVGFRPEALRVGDGPLAAHIRTVEDLGSEAFVHVAFDHEGETVAAVSKMPAPFKGVTGDHIDLQLAGTVHLFDPAGARIATGTARYVA
jgi:multiple sugar transport system ATP-binding protein